MATDRYSDDHKVVVGGSSGTKEFELQADTIRNSAASDFYITTENAYYTSNSGATFSCNGTKFSYTDESGINFYQNLIVNSGANIIFGDGSDLKMSDTSKIYGKEFDVWAGVGTATGTLSISANEGSNPKIILSQSGNSITETAGLWQVSANTIAITGDTVVIVNSTPRANTTIMPGSSFLILESYSGSGDSTNNSNLGVDDKFEHTTNGNVIWSMDTIGSGYLYGHVFAPLPESIPDGSVITNLGISLDREGDTNSLVTTAKIRVYKFSDGADEEWGTSLSSFFSSSIGHKTDYESLVNILPGTSGPTITLNKKEKAYSIKIQFRLAQGGSRCDIFLTSVKIGYTTTKLDPNI